MGNDKIKQDLTGQDGIEYQDGIESIRDFPLKKFTSRQDNERLLNNIAFKADLFISYKYNPRTSEQQAYSLQA